MEVVPFSFLFWRIIHTDSYAHRNFAKSIIASITVVHPRRHDAPRRHADCRPIP